MAQPTKFHVFNPEAVEQMYPHVCLRKLSDFDKPQFWSIDNHTVLECAHCGARFDVRGIPFRTTLSWSYA